MCFLNTFFSLQETYSVLCSNVYMEKKITTPVLRAREGTRRKLKLIAALTNESMLDVLDRLVNAELKRVQEKGDSPDAALYKD